MATGAASLPATFFIDRAKAETADHSTLECVTRSKLLRIAVVSGSPPYFRKDLATGEWTGVAIEMAKAIAGVWGAEVVFVETTWDNSVQDLQSNKIDISFGLNPTPQRALAIGFSRHAPRARSMLCRSTTPPWILSSSTRSPGPPSGARSSRSRSTYIRTRVVTGFYVGLDHPSILRAEVCVAQSMFEKGTWLAERGIDLS
jgi:hypothetical protein